MSSTTDPAPVTDELDLTPRHAADFQGGSTGNSRGSRRLITRLGLVAIVVALGFVLFKTLGDSALFFYDADQAVEQRDELGDRRFRVQGTPFTQAVVTEATIDGLIEPVVVFPIRFNEVVIDVVLTGTPAEMFQPGVPVVLDGSWAKGLPEGVAAPVDGARDDWYFAGTDMVVKHDNDYRLENQERLDQAERGGLLNTP